MKCECGNEVGRPLVSPRPISFLPIGAKERVVILYMGGMCGDKCWFCRFPNVGGLNGKT